MLFSICTDTDVLYPDIWPVLSAGKQHQL